MNVGALAPFPPAMDPIVVEHAPAAQEFRARVNGKRAVLQYRLAPGKISFVHTEVPETLRDRGIGDNLVHAGLEYAREAGLAVVPVCPFVAAYIHRHPEFDQLVLTGWKASARP